MNNAHLHLLVNHFPIIGNTISIFLLLWALIRNKRELMQLALAFSIIVALSGYAADFTGGRAAGEVKELPGITKDAIHEHAGAADWAIDFMYATGAVALVALYLYTKNKKAAKYLIYLTLALSVFTATTLYRTGYLGGLIRHPEISNSFSPHAP